MQPNNTTVVGQNRPINTKFRKCSNCGCPKISWYDDNGKLIPYEKLTCPKCGKCPPTVTQF